MTKCHKNIKRGTIMIKITDNMIKQTYITDTCVGDYKDMDGEIDFMLSPIDVDLDVDDLVDMDEGMCEILDREDEDSAVILEENQFDLVMCSII